MNSFGFHIGILILGHSVISSEMASPEYEIGTTSSLKKWFWAPYFGADHVCILISAVFAAPLTCHLVSFQLLISSALHIDCTRSLWTGATCLLAIADTPSVTVVQIQHVQHWINMLRRDTGAHKSWAPGRRGDYTSCSATLCLRVLSSHLAACQPTGA